MDTTRGNVRYIAPGATIGMIRDRFEVWEVTAPTEGATLIAAGQWLNERHGTAEERTVEAVAWSLGPDDGPPRYILRLTLSQPG
jgi:hypothetical protein